MQEYSLDSEPEWQDYGRTLKEGDYLNPVLYARKWRVWTPKYTALRVIQENVKIGGKYKDIFMATTDKEVMKTVKNIAKFM